MLQNKNVAQQPGGKITTLFGTKSQLFNPTLITPHNVRQQLVESGFLKAAAICTSTYATDCKKYGVS